MNIDILDGNDDESDLGVARTASAKRSAARPVSKKRPRIASLYDDDEDLGLGLDEDTLLVPGDSDFTPAPPKKKSKTTKAADTNKDDDNDVIPKPKGKKAAPAAGGEPKRKRSRGSVGSTDDVDPAQSVRDKIANVPPKKLKKVSKEDALGQMRLVFDTSFVNDARTCTCLEIDFHDSVTLISNFLCSGSRSVGSARRHQNGSS
jgi:hypothetical protein